MLENLPYLGGERGKGNLAKVINGEIFEKQFHFQVYYTKNTYMDKIKKLSRRFKFWRLFGNLEALQNCSRPGLLKTMLHNNKTK